MADGGVALHSDSEGEVGGPRQTHLAPTQTDTEIIALPGLNTTWSALLSNQPPANNRVYAIAERPDRGGVGE